jgi:phosphopantothenoylcysteine decarboxylase / phosphopantothenate---cysteine ligase
MGRAATREIAGTCSTARRLLLIIGGGIAAYKCLELIRRARKGVGVRAIMTRAAEQFVTPLSVAA